MSGLSEAEVARFRLHPMARARIEKDLRQKPHAEAVLVWGQEVAVLVARELALRAQQEAEEAAAHAADDCEARLEH